MRLLSNQKFKVIQNRVCTLIKNRKLKGTGVVKSIWNNPDGTRDIEIAEILDEDGTESEIRKYKEQELYDKFNQLEKSETWKP